MTSVREHQQALEDQLAYPTTIGDLTLETQAQALAFLYGLISTQGSDIAAIKEADAAFQTATLDALSAIGTAITDLQSALVNAINSSRSATIGLQAIIQATACPCDADMPQLHAPPALIEWSGSELKCARIQFYYAWWRRFQGYVTYQSTQGRSFTPQSLIETMMRPEVAEGAVSGKTGSIEGMAVETFTAFLNALYAFIAQFGLSNIYDIDNILADATVTEDIRGILYTQTTAAGGLAYVQDYLLNISTDAYLAAAPLVYMAEMGFIDDIYNGPTQDIDPELYDGTICGGSDPGTGCVLLYIGGPVSISLSANPHYFNLEGTLPTGLSRTDDTAVGITSDSEIFIAASGSLDDYTVRTISSGHVLDRCLRIESDGTHSTFSISGTPTTLGNGTCVFVAIGAESSDALLAQIQICEAV